MRQFMPAPGPVACVNCRFYAAPQADAPSGECRISRPQMGNDTRIGAWPLVAATAFCGEHDRRLDEAKA